MKRILSVLVTCSITSVALAQPANDNFANAIQIVGTSTNVTGSNTGATRQAGEPTSVSWPSSGNLSRRSSAGNVSVWWKWTSPSSGTVTLQTKSAQGGSSFDTQLGVYTGTLGSLNEVASAEDAYDPMTSNDNFLGGGNSFLTFNAISGTTYHIMVNGWESITGSIFLQLSLAQTQTNGYSLNVNVTGTGSVTRDPTQPAQGYPTNEVVTLTAVPGVGTGFAGWGGNASAFGSQNPIEIVMNTNKTVSATFTNNPTFHIFQSADPNEALDQITISPPANGSSGGYLRGTTVTITAIPVGTNQFHGWGGSVFGGTNPLTLVITNHLWLTAYFRPAVLIEPDFGEITEGDDFEFRALTLGPPLSYQWIHNGKAILGETNQVLSLEAAMLSYAGVYKVLATTGQGVITSQSAQLYLSPSEPSSFGSALHAQHLDWQTGGDAPWYVNDDDQELVFVSSGYIEANQRSWIETTIVGPGMLSFNWSVASEEYFDVLRFLINGNQQAGISGFPYWHYRGFAIPAGTNVIRWEYSKDGSVDEDEDRGFLRNVIYLPDSGMAQPVRISHPVQLRNGNFRMTLFADTGLVEVQSSTNMMNWSSVGQLENKDGKIIFEDRRARSFRQRFYRAIRP